MPKRTKKEKIIAESRRKIGSGHALPFGAPTYEYLATSSTTSAQKPVVQALQNDHFLAIKHDLVKTVCLAILIFAAEIILARVL